MIKRTVNKIIQKLPKESFEKIILRFEDEFVHIKDRLSASDMKYKAISEILIDENYLYLMLVTGMAILLPKAEMDEARIEFVKGRIEESGKV